MTIKYIATDGKSFDSANECMKYEKNLGVFIIEYFVGGDTCGTYTGDGKNFNLEYFLTHVIAFRVTNNYLEWNGYINHNFGIIRNSLRFHYNFPFIDKNNVNVWLGYTDSGELKRFLK